MKNEKVNKGRIIGLAGPCLNAVKAALATVIPQPQD